MSRPACLDPRAGPPQRGRLRAPGGPVKRGRASWSATSHSGPADSRTTSSDTQSDQPRGPGMTPRTWLGLLILVVLLAVADQATKAAAQAYLDPPRHQDRVVIPGILSFTYQRNPGGPFSWLAQRRWSWVLGPLSVVATAAVLWWLASSKGRSRLEAAACATIVGGAIGNIIDRLWWGAVRDFLKLSFYPPVFNLADVFICVGVALLLWSLFVADSKRSAEAHATAQKSSPTAD